MASPSENHPTRRDFLRLAAAAGLLGPAGCASAVLPESPTPRAAAFDPVAIGLSALADVHHRGWVPGHFGAAVLAGHYFALDNGLDERTTRAVNSQLEAFVARRPAEFPAPNPGPGASDPTKVVEALDGQIATLRSGGHNVIYVSLAMRALRDRPEFSTPAVIDGLCRLLEVFGQASRGIERTPYNSEHPMAPYTGAGDVTEAALRAMLRPWSDVRATGASGVVHWVTHAEALVTLEELGYGETARREFAAHQMHINRAASGGGDTDPSGNPVEWLKPEYWESERPRNLFGGTWLFGHAFKLPHSLFRLLRRTKDRDFRMACIARAAKLTIPFE